MECKKDILREKLNSLLGKPSDYTNYTPEDHLKLLEIQDKNYEYPLKNSELGGYMIENGLRDGFMPKHLRTQADEELKRIRADNHTI